MLKLQDCGVDLCADEATGIGQHAHESGFIVCKPDFKVRMSIAQHFYFLLLFTVVHRLSALAGSVARTTLSVLLPIEISETSSFPNTQGPQGLRTSVR
jgi:hypothetical protein